MNSCPECQYLGYPCPRHECDCAGDQVSSRCDEHGHLAVEPDDWWWAA